MSVLPGRELAQMGAALICEQGHSFDVARHGYVNLLPGDAKTGTADTAEMVAARARFLGGGHFAPIAEKVAEIASPPLASSEQPVVVDAGAGTGYYLAALLDAAPGAIGLALDLSKHAARRAARAHPRALSAVCDTWGGLPVRSDTATVVLDVFAPRNADEIARVLAPDGELVVVTPAPEHLAEAVDALGLISVDADKDARLDAALSPRFERLSVSPVVYAASLDRAALADLVAMGPSSRHISVEELDVRVRALPDPLAVTVSVAVANYRLREG